MPRPIVPEERRCTARSKTTGERCTNAAIKGGTVCPAHGGRAPQVRQRALEVVEEHRARKMLARLEQPEPIGHPVYELLKITAETIEWQRILRERLNDVTSLELTDNLGVERERAVVSLYERSLERSGRLLVDLAKLDLRARALKLNEETAAEVMSALVEALRRSGLGEHEQDVRMHLGAVLRERRHETGVDPT